MRVETRGLICILALCGCTPRQSDRLTREDSVRIGAEARAASDSIVARWVRLDGGGAMEYYAPDVVVVHDTARTDFRTYRQGWVGYDSALAAIRVTPIRQEVVPLARDLAVLTWVGDVALILKSGDTITTRPQLFTNVLRNRAGRWMVVHSTLSGTNVLHRAGGAAGLRGGR